MDDRVLQILRNAVEITERNLRAKIARVFLEETFGNGIKAEVRAEIVSKCCYPMTAAAVYGFDVRLRRKSKV